MSKLIEYRRKERDSEVSWGIGKDAVPVIVSIVLALLIIALIALGVSPVDVWHILKHLTGR